MKRYLKELTFFKKPQIWLGHVVVFLTTAKLSLNMQMCDLLVAVAVVVASSSQFTYVYFSCTTNMLCKTKAGMFSRELKALLCLFFEDKDKHSHLCKCSVTVWL